MAQPKFPSDQLGRRLKCTDCHGHLSVAPVVVLKDTGEYKCGRCCLTGQDRTGVNRSHPQVLKYKTAVRDLPYEELARHLLFPCKHRAYGCASHQGFQKVAEHERACQFSAFWCPVKCCTHRLFGPDHIPEHYRTVHRAEMCLKKWHSHVFTVPNKGSDGFSHRVFFSSDEKITFFLTVIKTKQELKLCLNSAGTNRAFKFQIKPGKFRNGSNNNAKILTSSWQKEYWKMIKLENWVKFKLEENNEEEYEFEVDFVGKVKQEDEMVKVRVEDTDVLKCAKCHRYLSVKPVMATKSGFECGSCFAKTEGDKVRMKAYETLAEMVLFPCEEPRCEKSFVIGEMKKHRDTHKWPENTKCSNTHV